MNLIEMAKQMKNLQKTRAALASQTATGTAGKGIVTVEVNGALQVKKVTIDPQLLEKKDAGYLERLVAEAVNDGLQRVQKLMAAKMAEMGGMSGMGGMNPFA